MTVGENRRKLTDLYRRGKTVTFDEDSKDPIAVWVQKLSPLERTEAVEKAGAARARVMLLKYAGGNEDERRLAVMTQADFEGLMDRREDMVEFLAAKEINQLRQSYEAELAEEEPWSTNGYLDGLIDTWGEIKDQHALEPTEDSAQVLAEIKRFDDIVSKKLAGDRKRLGREMAAKSNETLRNLLIDRLIEFQADKVFSEEYIKHAAFLGTRDPEDHDERYFLKRSEVDHLDTRITAKLYNEIEALAVDPQEGKD